MKVIELFAGVGGFRLGLQKASLDYDVVWSNQWEPSTKTQVASDIYASKFGSENHSNEDLAKVPTKDIPDHDLLVGGFPCQDYSVARTLNQAAGLKGKKGVLWWEIERIINEKKKNKPQYILLENVDRLLKSPAKQRGRDFAIMLASLSDLGYIVEWRVINAADYGMPQRRRRVFIMAYHQSTELYKAAKVCDSPADWVLNEGVLSESYPVCEKKAPQRFNLDGDLIEISDHFNAKGGLSPFANSGVIIGRNVCTVETSPVYSGQRATLKDVLEKNVDESYFIDEASLSKWNYLKGAKKEKRLNKTAGAEYNYAEGAMVFPDALDKPSRTVVTGEGGSAPSRFKHVIRTKDGRLRRLTPIELERLNMFPDNHTAGASDVKRAFLMGNALVVGIIARIGKVLIDRAGSAVEPKRRYG